MKILALDTSAKTASVALTDVRRLIAANTLNAGLTHSETLLPMVVSLLSDANTAVDDVDMFACTVGPGSFTGVRIGVSVVKGLAYGKNKVCVGVSTLEALARNIDNDGIIVPVMDARRSRLYRAVFRKENGVLTRLTEDDAKSVDEIAAEISEYGHDIYFVGDGYDIISGAFASTKETPEPLRCSNAYSIAAAALEKYEKADDAERKKMCDTLLFPEYLRPSQAERTLTSKGVIL